MDNINIFEMLFPEKKINKKIRLIELFGGYGSQALALQYLKQDNILKYDFEHYKICEWAINSIQAYKDLHFANDRKDYSEKYSFDEILSYLNGRISQDYNTPLTLEKIRKKGEQWCRKVFNNMKATNNLGSVCSINGNELEIVDTDKYEYILTYSYPCQDLSLAGKRAGMKKGSGTRSALLWEVDRLLTETKNKPQILLMENVPEAIGEANKKEFSEWELKLQQLGYQNYIKLMNAKDYGVAQNRNRVFMVSILGEYSYTFPQPIKLEKVLKDYLEDSVDEKYYLSQKMIDGMKSTKFESYKFENKLLNTNGIANTIIARFEGTPQIIYQNQKRCDGLGVEVVDLKRGYEIEVKDELPLNEPIIDVLGNYSKSNYNATNVVNKNGIAPTVRENHGGVTAIAIKNNMVVKNDIKDKFIGMYQYAKSDNFMKDKDRFTPNKEISDTLQTTPKEGVVEIEKEKNNQSMPKVVAGIGEKNSNNGTQWYQQNRIYEGEMSITISTTCNPYYLIDCLRVRKLTPKECFRLMGLREQSIDLISVNKTDSNLYHLAGDSIVVDCLYQIFKKLL